MRRRPSLRPPRTQALMLSVWLGASLLAIALPAVAAATSAEEHPRFGPILFGLAVLVCSAKVGGLLAERWRQPPVLGELLVGVALANLLPPILGESGIAFIRAESTLRVLVPLGLGWAASHWALPGRPALVHVFIGATLSATSVGITARVLQDLSL